jgi:hypothetical protein
LREFCYDAGLNKLLIAGAFTLAVLSWQGSAATLSTNQGDSDYPAACEALDGSAWAVWQTYADGSDSLFVSHWSGGQWSGPVRGPAVQGDFYKPACGVDGSGKLWLVWSRQVSSNWDLWASAYSQEKWSEPQRLTSDRGTDFAPRLARAPGGSLALVWQAWRGGSFDILFSELKGGRWSEPQAVTANAANDWAPAVAVSPRGVISVTWDSYRNGDYDVFLRQKNGAEWGLEIPVATGNRFEGYSSVAADDKGNVWIAYEERTERWGKDRGNAIEATFDELDTLLGYGRVRVRCFRAGRMLQPVQPPRMEVKPYDWGGDHLPQIAVGRDGRVWLAYRRPTIDQAGWNDKPPSWTGAVKKAGDRSMIPLLAWWNNYAVRLEGNAWSASESFHDTASRVDSDLAAIALPDGGLLGVWYSDDRRQERKDARFLQPMVNRIYAAVVPAPNTRTVAPVLGPAETGTAIRTADIARERRDVERVRSYRLTSGGCVYRIFRGDLHRHTDISWDGPSDASITDLFRYALDAAALDFVAPTDHNQFTGVDLEYVLWRTQKIVDLFNAPPGFVALYGYERGLGYPNGHRNVIEAKRGFPSFPRTTSGPRGGVAEDDTRQLYDHVRKTGGITIPHEVGEVGTVWRDRDPVEPIVEIYQGCRTSYEYEGAPRSDARLKPRFSYFPAGFVWEAWKKGFRLGVIASSDHQSTHISYANVYATEATREGLIEAMKQRHTFGSTDNLVLDFHTTGHMQGDDLASPSLPTFHIAVAGTAPIRELVIIKNFQVVYSSGSETPTLSIDWKDVSPAKTENHYYVRVLQTDGEIAWSSPIWITGK